MSEKQNEPTITEVDLKKSVESLLAILDTEDSAGDQVEEAVEKSMVATEGGLADQAGVPSLNPELDMGGQELLPDGSEGEDLDMLVKESIGRMAYSTPVEKSQMNKSEAAATEHDDEQVALDEADEFAKSLAEAFAGQEAIVDAAESSDFAKSLVLGTIEGLSIASEEFKKSLSEQEARNDAKIAVLAKGLAAIAQAVDEIRAEVVKVSNAPARPMAKSVQNVQVLEKSFGGNGGPVDPALIKSKITAALEKRVQAGQLDAFQLVRFESTGVLDPALAKDVQSELGL
jgi:hypothetical protein